jgi:Domain of unknown function (DUF222)
VVSRTRLVHDRDAMAKLDTEIAAHIVGWGSLSVDKTQNEIDYWVDRYDPAAVRRTEYSVRGRYADVRKAEDGSGIADFEARLLATDADALDQRLEAMARAICANDPRTLDQRRSDALGAIGHGADRLTCCCGSPDCEAADAQPSTVVVHVITHEESLSDDTPTQLDGKEESGTPGKPLREMTLREALAPPPPPTGPANTPRGHCWVAGYSPPHCWPPNWRAPPRSCRSATPATRRPNGVISRRSSSPPSSSAETWRVASRVATNQPTIAISTESMEGRRLPRRAHPGLQSQVSVSKTPPTENLRRLARPTVARRRCHVDSTKRAALHHPPG